MLECVSEGSPNEDAFGPGPDELETPNIPPLESLEHHDTNFTFTFCLKKSGPVLILFPFLEGPQTGPVPEFFRMQELWTGTAKNCKKPVETSCNWSQNEFNKTCAISVKTGHID